MHNLQQPKDIYKFASLESAKKIIEFASLKFSQPYEFNDPFDCDIDLADFEFNDNLTDTVKEEIEKFKSQYPNPNSPLMDPKSDLCILKDVLKHVCAENINKCQITCFSLTNEPVLMWSHYANKHTGVCIKFNNHALPRFPLLDEDKELSEGIVSYKAHERVNFLTTERKPALAKLVLSKSESWTYEQEYRIILFKSYSQFQKISPEFISDIYFGLKADKNDMSDLIELSKTQFEHVNFHKSSKKNLSLTFAPL